MKIHFFVISVKGPWFLTESPSLTRLTLPIVLNCQRSGSVAAVFSEMILGVIVTDGGAVEKRVFELEGEQTRERLQTLANILTSRFAGNAGQ